MATGRVLGGGGGCHTAQAACATRYKATYTVCTYSTYTARSPGFRFRFGWWLVAGAYKAESHMQNADADEATRRACYVYCMIMTKAKTKR